MSWTVVGRRVPLVLRSALWASSGEQCHYHLSARRRCMLSYRVPYGRIAQGEVEMEVKARGMRKESKEKAKRLRRAPPVKRSIRTTRWHLTTSCVNCLQARKDRSWCTRSRDAEGQEQPRARRSPRAPTDARRNRALGLRWTVRSSSQTIRLCGRRSPQDHPPTCQIDRSLLTAWQTDH